MTVERPAQSDPGAEPQTPPREGPSENARVIAGEHESLTPREILSIVGPGIIVGGADNDPAGITTYSVVGAQSGFSQNWLLLLSTPMLIVVQQMSARIGNVTKSDLGDAIRAHYGRRIAGAAITMAAVANLLTIGADLLMMSSVVQMLTGVRFSYVVIPLALFMAYITIFTNYKTFSKYLLWLVAIFASYIVAAILARPNWGAALQQTVIPHITASPSYFIGAVGLLGTTITPYLFFWQTSGEIEEKRGVQSIRRANLDIATGMIWSNLIALFIIIATGTVLYNHQATINTAADAAKALQPLAGPYAKYVFAIGILGSGLLAIPVLAASTAYSIASMFGWRRSLTRHVNNAPQFYLVLGIALIVGAQLAISDVNPIKTLFYSQVLDGFVAPALVILLVLLTSSRKVMGDFVNGLAMRCIGWATVGVLITADLALVYSVARSGLP